MTNLIGWKTPAAYDALLSTGLNTLTNGSSAQSSAVANGTDLYPLMDISVILASITPGTGGYVEIHLAPLMDDGTHYADVFAGGPTFIGSVPLASGASIKYGTLSEIQIPPGDFKISLVNQAGVSLASSGSTVKSRRYYIDANK